MRREKSRWQRHACREKVTCNLWKGWGIGDPLPCTRGGVMCRPMSKGALVSARSREGHVEPGGFDKLLRPVHRWVWSDTRRRAEKLMRFAETEADGGRDIARAAELTQDARLR